MPQEDLLAKLFEQLLQAEDDKSKNTESPENAENSERAENTQNDSSNDIFGNIDLEAIMKLGEMLSVMNSSSDKNTQLLLALKPHLRPENRQKVDNALKLIKIINILPLLKDSGILNGLF
ncbi:MAG: hypothetical protein HDT44_10430 [Ruminococcaceae bacterium]|nr:hypothetical protein [Oscillospiraceae bacterium]